MSPDQISQLERINQLLKEGVLNETEFNQAKQHILNTALETPPPVPQATTPTPGPDLQLQQGYPATPKSDLRNIFIIFLCIAGGLLLITWIVNYDKRETAGVKESALSTDSTVAISADSDAGTSSADYEKARKAAADKFKRLKPLMRLSKDDIDGNFYHAKGSPVYTNRNGFDVYFAYNDNVASNLRWRIQYYKEDWLFIERMVFLIDGKTYPFTPEKMERDNAEGMIWEWFDEPVTSSSREILDALVSAKSAKVRFDGKQYHDDQVITSAQRKAIKNVLEAYEALTSI